MPQFYIDSTDFSTATAIYSDALCTTPAQDGYYASCGVVRQQLNGTLLPYTECIDCKGYEKPVEGELLLDLYPDSAAAYSLRQLNTSYTGSAVRVRRASDSTEQDIGFVNMELDVTSLATFCAGANGFVVRWYDQSGNGNDAVRTITSQQPKIYDSVTGLLTDNGKPAITPSVVNCLVASPLSGNSTAYIFAVARANLTQTANLTQGDAGNEYLLISQDGSVSTSINGGSGAVGYYVNGTITTFTDRDEVHTIMSTKRLVTISADTSAYGAYVLGYSANPNSITMMQMSEWIVYHSDQSANRTGIETNINAHHNIYWDGSQPSLLDTYTGSAAAYSLRALNSDYVGPLVRVRRASDSAETDIKALYDGSLNVSALATFCAGTDGFVSVWYDQSGAGNDAVQATTLAQPQIVSSGSVLTDNGKPALRFNSKHLEGVARAAADANTIAFVGATSSTTSGRIFGNPNVGGGQFDITGGNWIYRDYQLSPTIFSTATQTATVDTQTMLFMYITTANKTARLAINGGTYSAGTTLTNSLNIITTAETNVQIAKARDSVPPNYYDGNMQEIILYTSDQSANRTGIETNINDYYTIY